MLPSLLRMVFAHGHITPNKKEKAFFSNDIFSLSVSLEKEIRFSDKPITKIDWIAAIN
jgi:hypothetical protein